MYHSQRFMNGFATRDRPKGLALDNRYKLFFIRSIYNMDIIKTIKIPFWGNPENNDMFYFGHLVDLNNLRRSKLIFATNKNLTYKQILTILKVTSYSNMEAHIMLVNKFSKNILTAPIKELVAQGFKIYNLSNKKELKNKYSSDAFVSFGEDDLSNSFDKIKKLMGI